MIKIELTQEEVNTVLGSLLELPAKFSMDLIEKIRSQAIPQIDTEKRGEKHESN